MSVNQSRMKRMSRSATIALTSSGVFGRSSLMAGSLVEASGGRFVAGLLRQPAPRPALELVHRGRQLPAHLGELVLDPDRSAGANRAHDDAVALELLHALGQQAIGELGHGLGDLTEAQGPAVDQDAHDRARPAAPDEL